MIFFLTLLWTAVLLAERTTRSHVISQACPKNSSFDRPPAVADHDRRPFLSGHAENRMKYSGRNSRPEYTV